MNNDNHRQNVTNFIINQPNAYIYANFCNKTFFSSYVPPQSRRILHTPDSNGNFHLRKRIKCSLSLIISSLHNITTYFFIQMCFIAHRNRSTNCHGKIGDALIIKLLYYW